MKRRSPTMAMEREPASLSGHSTEDEVLLDARARSAVDGDGGVPEQPLHEEDDDDDETSDDVHAATESAMSAITEMNGADTPSVKKRRTKNYKWREDMAKKSQDTILVRLPPLEPVTFRTWDEFISTWNEYMATTKTLYRRRSSCSTASWNAKKRFKMYPVPSTFQYATMAYWCTHGCIQPSRGTGVRAHLHNRFTGCTARISADVVFEKSEEGEIEWFIRVRNQISHHNHHISNEIYNCYTNSSSVPDELLLGHPEDVAGRRSDETVSLRRTRSRQNTNRFVHNAEDEDQAAASGAIGGSHEASPDERKMELCRLELQPVLDELRRTPSHIFYKRLQDVSEVVVHLLGKWQQDPADDRRLMEYLPAPGVPGRPATEAVEDHQVHDNGAAPVTTTHVQTEMI
ncbi:hypothetical protein Poli38472_008612 [Pythium oligandrum]|uniref:Uncharacterized protein n=1 Tax=Pythium oligandrum TaxID=41045 RepID=A0A8K1FCM1_PYTOL|nr:hypothetical protein Poli38472_008612 [Pythium oligandrum]|eukprot:TMW55964.1 hypothetical protein Poli38472_008612 [Pythium oligandrum]